jgi:hypothetical protein
VPLHSKLCDAECGAAGGVVGGIPFILDRTHVQTILLVLRRKGGKEERRKGGKEDRRNEGIRRK